jgi:drug/metabolite transporter (DMT)-like permease
LTAEVGGAAPSQRGQALRGHAAMLLFAALVSVSFTLGSPAAHYIEPAALTAARFALAACIIGILAAPQMKMVHFRAAWRYPVIGGLLAFYFIMMFEALRLTDPVSTSAVFTLTPIMSAFFGWLILRQMTTPVMAISLALAGLGAVWVIFRADLDAILGVQIGLGERIMFIGCAGHALYAPLARKLNRDEPILVYTFGGICGGLLVTMIYGAGDVVRTDWANLPMIAWAAVFYLAIFATAGSFFLVQYAILRLPSSKVMAYGYLVPSFVILWEGSLGNGWVAAPVWLGVGLTVVALLVLLRDRT